MAVRQKRRTFVNPYKAVKRPSYKAAAYKGRADFYGNLSRLTDKALGEDDKRKRPVKYNTVAPYIKQMIAKLPPNERLRPGEEPRFVKGLTHKKFNDAYPDVVTADELDDIKSYYIDEEKMTPPAELARPFLTRVAEQGGDYDRPPVGHKNFFDAVRDQGGFDRKYDIGSLMGHEEANKYALRYNYASMAKYINTKGEESEKTGGLVNLLPIKEEIALNLQKNTITQAQARKLLQQLASVQYRGLNNKVMQDNALFNYHKNKAYEDYFQGSPETEGMKQGDKISYDTRKVKDAAGKLARAIDAGQIGYYEALDVYRGVDAPNALIEYDKQQRRLRGRWDIITESVLPQGKTGAMALDTSKQTLGVTPTADTKFGRQFISRMYQNLASDPEKGAEYQSLAPKYRKNFTYKALGIPQAEDYDATEIFKEMDTSLSSMGIQGSGYADALSSPLNDPSRERLANLVRQAMEKYPDRYKTGNLAKGAKDAIMALEGEAVPLQPQKKKEVKKSWWQRVFGGGDESKDKK